MREFVTCKNADGNYTSLMLSLAQHERRRPQYVK